jgi:hypothetical protein
MFYSKKKLNCMRVNLTWPGQFDKSKNNLDDC